MALRPPLDMHDVPGDHSRLHARLTRGMLFADGAIGTMLQAKGLQPGEPAELWNLTQPQAVQEIHEAYLEVGCDVVQTNTFGANPLRLKERGLGGQTEAINTAAVHLARGAGAAGHLVAGTIGPTGCFHKGGQSGSSQDIRSAFEEQVSYLVHEGVDLVLIETMTHLDEARMALQAAQTYASVPVVVSLVFFEEGEALLTLDDAPPHDAVRELAAAQVVGCNCMNVEHVVEVLRQMREATSSPLIAQPHAGLPMKHQTPVVYPLTPEEMAHQILPLLELTPRILGGCCGTTPAHLEAVIRSVRRS
jgi:5-methyltetrahydrofolate--homocysteine methyltransferase